MSHSPYPTECSVMVQPGEPLQAAIDGAEEGAIICLAEGRWEENLKIEKSLTLRGTGQQKTVIEGQEEGYPAVRISSMKRTAVKVEGLAIARAVGECADWHKGICPDGLLIQGEAKVEITDSTISGNRRDGLSLWGSARAAIINSAIFGNGHYGLWLWDSARAEISGSTISENGFGLDD
jgi:nitrous oxidase accessory protein